MQDFRTRVVCPYCGQSVNFQLIRYGPPGKSPAAEELVIRRCLECDHEWPVDASLRGGESVALAGNCSPWWELNHPARASHANSTLSTRWV